MFVCSYSFVWVLHLVFTLFFSASLLEQGHQSFHIVLVCADMHTVHVGFHQHLLKVSLCGHPPLVVCAAHGFRGGVYQHLVSSLRVSHLHESDVGQFQHPLVVDLQGADVVLAAGDEQLLAVVALVEEVAQQENRGAFLECVGQVFQCLPYVRVLACGLELQQFSDDEEDVFASLLGGDELFHVVGEEDYAYLVVVLYGGEGDGGRYLCHHVALGLVLCAEVEAARHVHQQDYRQLSFLLEHLYVCSVEAGGYVPVYVTHVVAILVFSHFAERHASSLEG